ncbi:MAG: hypothetical protein K8J31_06895 [Anaerolineae bacterium]|nr:hypothetical protein [Anaerolineae bacterium]
MTLDELKTLIDEAVERRLEGWLKSKDERSPEEILESIRKHRWTPPPGTPSTLQMLREDRDR